MTEVYTIGVYGSTEESFFEKLIQNEVDLFCDIRQRRGVRGSQYKYVNSIYLQQRLHELGIAYLYIKELAPTAEIREKQKEADKARGEAKKMRQRLGIVFSEEYRRQILETFDFDKFLARIKDLGARRIVLFCVEECADACHRSLVARSLADAKQCKVIDL